MQTDGPADGLATLGSMGFTLPGPAYLFGAILFGIVGLAAFRYGAKSGVAAAKWTGIALMLYPYAISETWLLYLVGAVLCVLLYFTARR
jgi:hypothetical protein